MGGLKNLVTTQIMRDFGCLFLDTGGYLPRKNTDKPGRYLPTSCKPRCGFAGYLDLHLGEQPNRYLLLTFVFILFFPLFLGRNALFVHGKMEFEINSMEEIDYRV